MPSSDQEQSSSDDLEAADQDIRKRITFGSEGPRERSRFRNGSRRRSPSRDSILSAIQEAKLSNKLSEERKRKKKVEEVEEKDYFEHLDYHKRNGNDVCDALSVHPDKGLSASKAST
ncbi:hypothetical protein VE04_07946 [Pseudogymnoascus sp. 24MN13]|nr:hypothetical protein VE04_07946 [Pseudogymnoascus sp. 24MN13]